MSWEYVRAVAGQLLTFLAGGMIMFAIIVWISPQQITKPASTERFELLRPSGSMMPCISAYDQVVINYNYSNIEVGDIIKYRQTQGSGEPEQLILHRVIWVINTTELPPGQETLYIVKGDANAYPDPWYVTPKSILGPVKKVEMW